MARSKALSASIAFAGLLSMLALANAQGDKPVLHERIPPDPAEDLAMKVAPSRQPGATSPHQLAATLGLVDPTAAPDPLRLPSPLESAYTTGSEYEEFQADRDTRRPEVSRYSEPFVPSTAPFKRLAAFDAVRDDYVLYVHDARLVPMSASVRPGPDEDLFFEDVVVDVAPRVRARIPSVGPGARIVRGRLGLGAESLGFFVAHDDADNWFVQATAVKHPGVARLVLQLSIPRAAFGGPFSDVGWLDLPRISRLPENVARDAAAVRAAIGVSRRMRPREAIAKLVEYHRGFVEGSARLPSRGNLYLDLALSKHGVCRHRAFSFLVTAQSLGIPTRMVMNEAHAWVEVNDGALWRRIDLGGAGRLADPIDPRERNAFRAPPDVLPWPDGTQSGDAMVTEARARGASSAAAGGDPNDNAVERGETPFGAGAPNDKPGTAGAPNDNPREAPFGDGTPNDQPGTTPNDQPGTTPNDQPGTTPARPPSNISLAFVEDVARRGFPLHVRGDVHADGQPCPRVAVELWLKPMQTQPSRFLGTLATGEGGSFAGGIVVPTLFPLGDYDVTARTMGDARCGPGTN